MNNSLISHHSKATGVSSKVVVSRGNPLSKLMIVGEAPGAMEEELGQPFVGRSGKVLDDLFDSVGIDTQKDAYICNVVKCRPPKNRRPTKEEIQLNLPWLYQQIKLVDPLVIVLVGATSVEALLGIRGGISRLRGTWQNWEGRLVMPLFHPAYLLRNPSKEEGAPISLTLLDLIKVREKLRRSHLFPVFSNPESAIS
ncbi:uracil-DNA glycosylase [Prochlorococcus sp. MIT 1223]|uniref:uracil-DNA glycosylase n=1 Tax=Prochlorococcus sp. MIT 1223 TaxID=3096217 RepID=UPI002A74F2EF|nr:uracil-DNA glycosylase [Prochlorococcus sp. MIT 1223]